MYKKIILSLALLSAVSLSAEVKDKFKINIGAMAVTDFGTRTTFDKDLPLLGPINLEKELGFKSETGVLRIDGYYRFNHKHSLDFSYFGVKSSGFKRLDKNIELDGREPIPVGADVDSYFNMNVYKLSYGYSVYHTDKLELMLSAGFHITDISMGLDAVGDEGIDLIRSGESVTLPLPVFGFRGEYTLLSQSLFATFKAEYFYLKYEDYVGSVGSATLGLEYRFLDNYGLGIGYNANIIRFEDNGNDKTLKIKNQLSGVMINLSYIY